MSETIVCAGSMKDCINFASYGEICVHCNACGRYDKNTMWQARYRMYLGELGGLLDKVLDESYQSNLQQKNIALDVITFGERLKECVEHIDFGKPDWFGVNLSELKKE